MSLPKQESICHSQWGFSISFDFSPERSFWKREVSLNHPVSFVAFNKYLKEALGLCVSLGSLGKFAL